MTITAYSLVVFLIDLLITVLLYGAVPVVTMFFGKKPISKATFRWICFGLNFCVWLVFNIFKSVYLDIRFSHGGAYLLWSTIFYNIGIRWFRKHGHLLDDYDEEDENDDPFL